MSNPDPSLEQVKPYKFQKGQSGNPGGKPVATRNKLQGNFMRALSADFEKHGEQAIVNCRTQDPVAYVKICASLMPKQLEEKKPLEDLNDDELIAAVALLRSRLAQNTGAGAGETCQ